MFFALAVAERAPKNQAPTKQVAMRQLEHVSNDVLEKRTIPYTAIQATHLPLLMAILRNNRGRERSVSILRFDGRVETSGTVKKLSIASPSVRSGLVLREIPTTHIMIALQAFITMTIIIIGRLKFSVHCCSALLTKQ